MSLSYTLEPSEEKELDKALTEKSLDKDAVSNVEVEKVEVCISFDTIATPN